MRSARPTTGSSVMTEPYANKPSAWVFRERRSAMGAAGAGNARAGEYPGLRGAGEQSAIAPERVEL